MAARSASCSCPSNSPDPESPDEDSNFTTTDPSYQSLCSPDSCYLRLGGDHVCSSAGMAYHCDLMYSCRSVHVIAGRVTMLRRPRRTGLVVMGATETVIASTQKGASRTFVKRWHAWANATGLLPTSPSLRILACPGLGGAGAGRPGWTTWACAVHGRAHCGPPPGSKILERTLNH